MPTKQEYAALSNFRYRLARFMRFSEVTARAAGMTPKQYLLLLHICGTPGRNWASVGELADRLQASAHGTVGLINRCNAAHLVTRCRNAKDARLVEVHTTPRGRRLVAAIATRHRSELQSLRRVFQAGHVR